MTKTHEEIYDRLEQLDIRTSVQDEKLNHIQDTVDHLDQKVDENGRLSRQTQTQLKMASRMSLAFISALGVFLAFLRYTE